ncbi:hypothetical protein FJT64_005416 [Amphibalanus amphitrite]|uniref:Uncharacterized protein n=1 Tax=Amphibalanus amphitrite TaxID=1232801 RepID=A0A6A4VR31_AMPAM|nr:hypothetical protein FJT64_005416 [Amphibalanus amphitrite]
MKTESGGELEQSTMHQAVSSSVPAFLAKLWGDDGFRKVLSPMAGSLRNESDEMIFAHPDFVKDEPWGLENIKRKVSAAVLRAPLGPFQPSAGFLGAHGVHPSAAGWDDTAAFLHGLLVAQPML